MEERTATHRQSDTSPTQGPVLNPAGHTFPRIFITATMAFALGVLMPGCHGSSTRNGAQSSSGDPSDVNAAETQSSCPNGQVLMSDGSCGAANQAQPQPAAGAQPAQSTPAQTAPAQSYPAQNSAPPPQQDAQYSSPPPQQQYPPDQNSNNTTNREGTPASTTPRIPTTTRPISRTPTTTATSRAMSRAYRPARRRRSFPSMSSHRAPVPATSGTPATGPGAVRLLLGAGRLGARALHRRAMDAPVVGLLRRPLSLALRLLGLACRLLRRRSLRLRIYRFRLPRRLLGP